MRQWHVLSVNLDITLLTILISFLVLVSCDKQSPSIWQPYSAQSGDMEQTFNMRPSDAEISSLSKAVINEGHQPWRLSPRLVAEAGLSEIAEDKSVDKATQIMLKKIVDLRPQLVSQNNGAIKVFFYNDDINIWALVVNSNKQNGGIWFVDKIVIARHDTSRKCGGPSAP